MKQITKQNARDICRAKPDKWDKDTEWVYGYYVRYGNRAYIIPLESTKWCVNTKIYSPEFIEIAPDTKCRCIDSKDKEDNWIFEKDIVEVDKNCYAVSHGGWGRTTDVVKLEHRTWLEHEEFGHEGENLIEPFDTKIIGNTIEDK